jgi:N-acetylneuraminic acid mutarotase
VVGDEIYLIGGSQYVDVFPFNSGSDVNEVYNPTTDTWTSKPKILNLISGYASATVENKIYVMGGWCTRSDKLNQIFDTTTETWSYAKNMTIGAFSSGAGKTTGTFAAEKIYIFGTQPQSNIALNITQVYYFKNDEWSLGTPMPTPRYGLEVAVMNDELYAIGGKNQTTFFATNEKYTPKEYIPEFSSWTPMLTMVIAFIVTGLFYGKKLRTNKMELK